MIPYEPSKDSLIDIQELLIRLTVIIARCQLDQRRISRVDSPLSQRMHATLAEIESQAWQMARSIQPRYSPN